jgi:hypothetical protein
MRSFVRPFDAIAVLLLMLGGCAASRISSRENSLAAAGFIVRPANTPERVAMLKRLPSHRFVLREHGDTVSYVYADPLVCGCLYVGSQKAYDQYRRDEQEKKLANEEQLTADRFADAGWNWGAWGPWGGYGFVYGPGVGW